MMILNNFTEFGVFKRWLKGLLCVSALTLSTAVLAEVIPLDRIIAIVDQDVITETMLNKRMEVVQAQLEERKVEVPSEHVLREQLLERMILEELQLQIAKRAGVQIDDWSLSEAIRNIAERNNMTLEEFKSTLASDGLTYAKAREEIRREMIINRVRQRRVMDRIHITDREIDNYINSAEGQENMTTEYRLGHILISVPDGATPDLIQEASAKANEVYKKLKKGADFSQVAVVASQGDNALKGGDLGWRQSTQLPELFANTASHMKVGDISAPVKSPNGYHILKLIGSRGNEKHVQQQMHVRHILIKPNEIRGNSESQQLAAVIYEKLQNGANFSELARRYSDDPGSALEGGDLGWVSPGDMVPAFREKMTTLNENIVSAPFQSQFGWHVLQVKGKRNEDITSKVKRGRIRSILQQRRYEEELQSWLRELRDQAYVDIKIK